MKTIAVFLATIAFSIVASLAEDEIDYAKVNPATITKAIGRLLDDPLSEDADGYSALIVNFAEASPDITISLSIKLLPWLENEDLPEKALLLTSAYVAGNVCRQIELGGAKDSPAAGVVSALKMYRKLRETNSLPEIAILERWGKLTPEEIVKESGFKE